MTNHTDNSFSDGFSDQGYVDAHSDQGYVDAHSDAVGLPHIDEGNFNPRAVTWDTRGAGVARPGMADAVSVPSEDEQQARIARNAKRVASSLTYVRNQIQTRQRTRLQSTPKPLDLLESRDLDAQLTIDAAKGNGTGPGLNMNDGGVKSTTKKTPPHADHSFQRTSYMHADAVDYVKGGAHGDTTGIGRSPYTDTGYVGQGYIDSGYTDAGYTDVFQNIDPHAHGGGREYWTFGDQHPHIDSGAPPWGNRVHSSSANAKYGDDGTGNGGGGGGGGSGGGGGGTFADTSQGQGGLRHTDTHNDGESGSFTDGPTFVDSTYSDHADSDGGSVGDPDDFEPAPRLPLWLTRPVIDPGGTFADVGSGEEGGTRRFTIGANTSTPIGNFADAGAAGSGSEAAPTHNFAVLPYAFVDDYTDTPQTTPDPNHALRLLSQVQAQHRQMESTLATISLLVSAVRLTIGERSSQ